MALMCNFLYCSDPGDIEHGPARWDTSSYLQGMLRSEAFYFPRHKLFQNQVPAQIIMNPDWSKAGTLHFDILQEVVLGSSLRYRPSDTPNQYPDLEDFLKDCLSQKA